MFISLALALLLVVLFYEVSSRERSGAYALPSSLRWIIFGQAGVLALAVGGFFWRTLKMNPEPYPDFIGGFLGISGMPKSFEYTAEYAGLATFALIAFFLHHWYRKLAAEPQYEPVVFRIGFFSLLPGFLMVGQSIRIASLEPLTTLPALAVLLSFPALAAVRPGAAAAENRVAERCFAGLAFFVFSLAGIQFFRQRVWDCGLWIVFLYAAALLFLLFRVRQEPSVANGNRFLLVGELGVPLLFFYLLPPPYLLRDGSRFDPGFGWPLYVVVWLLVAAGLLALLAGFRKESESRFRVPLPVLLALTGSLLAGAELWPTVWSDDYHNGETVLPWYLMQTMGCLPYIDYIPARGGINYLPGFFTWLILGHDLSQFAVGQRLTDLLLLALLLSPFRRRCGTLVAVFGTLTVAVLGTGMNGGLAAALALFFFLTEPARCVSPVRWLWYFGLLGLAGVFYSLTDTAALVLALLPLACFQLWNAVLKERRAFCISIGILALAALALALTPFYRMVAGMVRILLEQSGVYTLAHCVPWRPPRTLEDAVTQGLFWQFVRFAFLGVGALALAGLFRRRSGALSGNIRFLGCAGIFILALLLIQRAGGRIDQGSGSRIFIASAFFVGILLPWLLAGLKRRRLPLALWCAATGVMGMQCVDWETLWTNGSRPVAEPENVVNLEAAGFPMLGRSASIQSDHFRHLTETRQLLDALLKPEESYLDMTNNATGYAYFRRRPPVSYPAWNYVASRAQVERMVKEVDSVRPPLVLVKGRDVQFYEGRLPFRAHALYRYLLANYTPFRDAGGRIWMIRKGEEKRLDGVSLVIAESVGDLALAAEAFQDPSADAYPFVWGNSLETLEEHLSDPVELRISGAEKIRQAPGGTLVALSGGAVLHLEPPAGASGDFLLLEFDRPVLGRGFRVSWEDALAGRGQPWIDFWGYSNRYLIPLDNSPNWLLSPWRRNLRVRLPDGFGGEFRLLRAELLRRR